jgi:hypothetical protein
MKLLALILFLTLKITCKDSSFWNLRDLATQNFSEQNLELRRMESKELLKTLLHSQSKTMLHAFDDLPNHRSPPGNRSSSISVIEAHIQAHLEINYVLSAGRFARHAAYKEYRMEQKEQKLLHENAVHVLSTELFSARMESPKSA